MRWKQIEDEPKTFAVIFETGYEIASALQQFADRVWQEVVSKPSALFLTRSSVGSTGRRKSTIPPAFSTNKWNCFRSIGDIALKDGEPQVHAHVVVGRSDGTAHGGHLLEARVRPTCELILAQSPIHLQKKLDSNSGIALIQI